MSAASANAAATATPRSDLWIMSWWRDLLLFVGTPLLIVPAILLAESRWSADSIYLFVASFGAVGHHLPGMMRAYGDRALFERFRVRFLVAPIFLAGVCLAFTLNDMNGIQLVIYLWGVWHGLMQTYGFLRIYDGKVRSVASITSRLDQAMCLVWFGAAVVVSDSRMWKVLNLFYDSGGGLIPDAWILGARAVAGWSLVAVTAAFLLNLAFQWTRGRRPSPVKLLLMATSFGFWWYSNVAVESVLVGIALFEVFHDVQYLSIVWFFNRNRVRGMAAGRFTRFMFRRSGALIGAYVGLVFAYGSLNLVAQGIDFEPVQRFLFGMLAASTLLHFYFDGFIWKVREKQTGENLGIEGGRVEPGAAGGVPRWLGHGLKWVLFVLPVAAIGLAGLAPMEPTFERSRAMVRLFPEQADAHYNLGVLESAAGETRAALGSYREAIRLDPEHADAHFNAANAYLELGTLDEAIASFQRVRQLRPDATVHLNLGNALLAAGRPEAAEAELRAAVRLDPDLAPALYNLGNVLAWQGRHEEARRQYDRAVAADPESAEARFNLATFQAARGQIDEAIAGYREAVRLDPGLAEAHFNLANALVRSGRPGEAMEEYRAVLAIRPDADAHRYLASLLAADGRLDEAIVQYRSAIEVRPGMAEAHNNLGAVLARAGRLPEAVAEFRRAVELAPGDADVHANLGTALAGLGAAEESRRHLAEARRLRASG